jgi:single-strand DNA-binding protein
MRTSKYEKDGQDHYSTEIAIDEVVFCGSKRDGGGDRDQAPRDRAPSTDRGRETREQQQGYTRQGQGSFDTGRGNGPGPARAPSNGGQQRQAAPRRNPADDFNHGGGQSDDEIPF